MRVVVFAVCMGLFSFCLVGCGAGVAAVSDSATGIGSTGSSYGSSTANTAQFNGTQFFGDSLTCGYGGANAFSGVGNFTTGGFAYLVQAALGGTYGNDCLGGNMVLDSAATGRVYGLRDPGESNNPIYFLGDATNDAAFDQRSAQRLDLSHAAYLGALYWLSIPPRGKIMARTCRARGFVADDSVETGMGMASMHSGDTLTCTVETTHSEPIVFAYQIQVGDAGRFTLTIDNGPLAIYGGEAAGLQSITYHGSTSTVLAVRLPVATGVHNVTVTNVSPTGSGTVSVQWLAAPPRTDTVASLPYVVTLSAIHPLLTDTVVVSTYTGTLTGKEFDAVTAQYDAWIQAATAQAQQDGLNVHYADTRSALGTDPANYHDAIHPNQAGYALMARAILKLFGK